MDRLTEFADYFRKIPAAFLVAIFSALGLILFLPEETAKTIAVNEFRKNYRVYLGPAFLFTGSFLLARLFIHFRIGYGERQNLKILQKTLHQLTPEEKGYLVPFIVNKQNTIHVGMEDGIMGGLIAKKIKYLASNRGSHVNGFAFNLNPWARAYLEKNYHLLNDYAGEPMTPRQRIFGNY